MVSEDKPTFLEDCKKEMAVIIIQQMNDQYDVLPDQDFSRLNIEEGSSEDVLEFKITAD